MNYLTVAPQERSERLQHALSRNDKTVRAMEDAPSGAHVRYSVDLKPQLPVNDKPKYLPHEHAMFAFFDNRPRTKPTFSTRHSIGTDSISVGVMDTPRRVHKTFLLVTKTAHFALTNRSHLTRTVFGVK